MHGGSIMNINIIINMNMNLNLNLNMMTSMNMVPFTNKMCYMTMMSSTSNLYTYEYKKM